MFVCLLCYLAAGSCSCWMLFVFTFGLVSERFHERRLLQMTTKTVGISDVSRYLSAADLRSDIRADRVLCEHQLVNKLLSSDN